MKLRAPSCKPSPSSQSIIFLLLPSPTTPCSLLPTSPYLHSIFPPSPTSISLLPSSPSLHPVPPSLLGTFSNFTHTFLSHHTAPSVIMSSSEYSTRNSDWSSPPRPPWLSTVQSRSSTYGFIHIQTDSIIFSQYFLEIVCCLLCQKYSIISSLSPQGRACLKYL